MQHVTTFVLLQFPHKWHTFYASLLAAGRGITQGTVPTRGPATRAYYLHAVTVRAGKSIVFFYPAIYISDDAVATRDS